MTTTPLDELLELDELLLLGAGASVLDLLPPPLPHAASDMAKSPTPKNLIADCCLLLDTIFLQKIKTGKLFVLFHILTTYSAAPVLEMRATRKRGHFNQCLPY
ncbi:MAG: hypothetical protein RL497_1025 [Pseudomonadota bacterium]